MIEFIRKNKDLKEIFEELENSYTKQSNSQKELSAKNLLNEENNAEFLPPPIKNVKPTFYEVLCRDFVSDLRQKSFQYCENLIKVNISFLKNEPVYRLSFPLIDINESQSKIFVQSLKNSIKKSVSGDYSVNLCLRNEDETHNIVLILTKNIKSTQEFEKLSEV